MDDRKNIMQSERIERNPMSLKDKIVVVTGGSRGIGKACCLEFAKQGTKIIFTYNKSKDEAEGLSSEISKIGSDSLMLQVDIRNFDQCRQFSETVLDKFNGIDILINNAGIIKDSSILMMQQKDWLDVIDTNLNGTFNITKSFIVTFMKQKQGSIINISSLSGVIGLPRQVNYSASKGGIVSFTRALAKEVASFNIRVNCIAPGFIQTDMLKGLKDEYISKVIPQIPLQRFGTPEEVAKVALFLAGDEANYITGQVIKVDGGLGM